MVDIADWTVDHVASWLKMQPGLDLYADSFREHHVDGHLLLELDEDMLIELGIEKKLLRRKFVLARDKAVADKVQARPRTRTLSGNFALEDEMNELTERLEQVVGPPPTEEAVGESFSTERDDHAAQEPVYMEIGEKPQQNSGQAPGPRQDTYMAVQTSASAGSMSSAPSDDIYAQVPYEELERLVVNAANNDIRAHKKLMGHLANMFPRLRVPDIELAFASSGGKLSETVDLCLSMQNNPEIATGLQQQAMPSRESFSDPRDEQDSTADWLHPRINREQAEQLLDRKGMSNGLFLIRSSASQRGAHVLSVAANGQPYHHLILPMQPIGFEMLGMQFRSLTDMVHFLSDYHPEDGWRCPLTQHVSRADVQTYMAGEAQTNYMMLPSSDSTPRSRAASSVARRSSMSSNRVMSPKHDDPKMTVALPTFELGQSRSRTFSQRTKSFLRGKRQPPPSSVDFQNPAFHNTMGPSSGGGSPARGDGPSPPPLPARQPSALRLTPEDFDLDPHDEPAEYVGDQTFSVSVAGNILLGLGISTGHSNQPLWLFTFEDTMSLRKQPNGANLYEWPYSGVTGVEAGGRMLRFFHEGAGDGVFSCACDNAETLREVILANQTRLQENEDRRMAQLLQNDEFVAQLVRSREFQQLARAQGQEGNASVSGHTIEPSTDAAMERKQKKAILKRLAKTFSVRRRRTTSSASRRRDGPVSVDESPVKVTSATSLGSPGLQERRRAANAPLPPLPPLPPDSVVDDESLSGFGGDSYGEMPPRSSEHGVRHDYTPMQWSDEQASQRGSESEPVDHVLGPVIATRDRQTLYDDEALCFHKGDRILLLQVFDNGWALGEFHGKRGKFPITFVEPGDDYTRELLGAGSSDPNKVYIDLDHDRRAHGIGRESSDAPPSFDEPDMSDSVLVEFDHMRMSNVDEGDVLESRS